MSFRFKQFFVADSRCAMKVGTDGVLLGRYASVPERPCARVLDVGTGSGLVALMMAQQAPNAQIDAIDIDEAAAEQAEENFQASPWADRLHAYTARLQEWKPEKKYDLIVSNPPYFQNSLKNPDRARQTARHTDSLSYEELLANSVRLLADEGVITLILPAEEETNVCAMATAAGLSLTRLTRVFSKESKPARRVLMSFELTSRPIDVLTDILVLEDEKGGRSAAYQELMKDFYL